MLAILAVLCRHVSLIFKLHKRSFFNARKVFFEYIKNKRFPAKPVLMRLSFFG